MYKFIQSNVWFGGKLHENLIPYLAKEQPDFIAMQEVVMPVAVSPYTFHPALDFVDTVKRQTGLIYSVFAPDCSFRDKTHYESEHEVQFGVAILSRFPIKAFSYRNYIHEYQIFTWETMDRWDIMPKGILVCEVDVKGKPLYLSTTHGVWGFDDKDNLERDGMINAILQETEGKSPLLFSGDLNTGQQTRAIARLEERFVNVFKGKLETSFNMLHKSGGTFSTSVVDFVFATKDIRIEDAYSTDENVSDHVPLVIKFDI